MIRPPLDPGSRPIRRFALGAVAALALTFTTFAAFATDVAQAADVTQATQAPQAASAVRTRQPLAEGVVWQPDNDHANPHGIWDQLGVRDLLVQWTAVDGVAFVPATGMPRAARQPDWTRIAREPWARDVIVGLAGRFDEASARAGAAQLIAESVSLAAARPPVHITGWYFPVEIDPTWKDADTLRALLASLPRPLWISVYDRANVGGAALADWLDTWLPRDVGVFLQDGCGVYAREPRIARQYADQLSAKLGRNRVRIIAEAFRPKQGGGFRAASVDELKPQLDTYEGYRVYLFDGPHYVSDDLVHQLLNSR
ncbi:hypothetical protein [Paraburkholderia sp.]|uniref:hypothetical protein n=1 Tax=Paraburkholderia sp. TaxID=1926495 RepID=UPI00239DAC63|nr:hypothetical protein [Paraburkholderia sp.]MDE1180692.1 hypothetical protein [Paraburkholderia sp.]